MFQCANFGFAFGEFGKCLNKQQNFSWWAFLDRYRTLCLAPSPEIREIFEELRDEAHLPSLLTTQNDTA